MSDKFPTFVRCCLKRDNQIWQRRAERAAQNKGGVGFASSPKPPAPLSYSKWSEYRMIQTKKIKLELHVPPQDSAAAPARSVAGYTRPAPVDFSSGKRRIWEEQWATRFADGRCLYCGGCNHRAADCTARKKAQAFKAAGAELMERGTWTGSGESGKDFVNWRRMALQLTIEVLFHML